MAPSEKQIGSAYAFAPDSLIWRVNREQVLLLGGARALLMQIAHPMVAEAVYNHSYVFRHPLRRLHRTLNLTLSLVFGTHDEIEAAIAEIRRAHRPATGVLADGVGAHPPGAPYNPRNPRQALWVFATLIEGAISGYERFVGPLRPFERDTFYADSTRIGEWMGIRSALFPPNYEALRAYMDNMIAEGQVAVGAKARAIAPFITGQSIAPLRPFTLPMRRLTAGLLPSDLRAQYGYRWSLTDERLLDQFSAWVRRIVPQLPPQVRYAPEYRRALAHMR